MLLLCEISPEKKDYQHEGTTAETLRENMRRSKEGKRDGEGEISQEEREERRRRTGHAR